MRALIYILAIVMIAAGLGVGLVSSLSMGQVVLGLDLHLAGTLLAGGVVTLALAGVMSTLDAMKRHLGRLANVATGPATGNAASSNAASRPADTPKIADAKPAEKPALEGAAGLAAAEVAATSASRDETSPSTEATEVAAVAGSRDFMTRPREEATDKDDEANKPAAERQAAETDDKDDKSADAAPAEEEEEVKAEKAAEAAEAEQAAAESDEDDLEAVELYVIEERTILGRPARLLSDGTVEAETDEGWMRFENLEHLEEYTAAVEKAQ